MVLAPWSAPWRAEPTVDKQMCPLFKNSQEVVIKRVSWAGLAWPSG